MTEQKTLVDDLLKKIKNLLLAEFTYDTVREVIKSSYNQGIDEFEQRVQPLVNSMPNPTVIAFLSKYTFENIKGMNEDLAERLRKQLIEGMMQGETSRQLKERVRVTIDVSKSRASAIAITETHRAYNYGAAFAAKQSGLKLLKYAYNPKPKSIICQHVANKDPIPMEKDFSYDGNSWQIPPFHPNCRSKLLMIQEADA